MTEGWVSIANARKFHYFRGGISLCRKFAYLGEDLLPDTGLDQSSDCMQCARKLRPIKPPNAGDHRAGEVKP